MASSAPKYVGFTDEARKCLQMDVEERRKHSSTKLEDIVSLDGIEKWSQYGQMQTIILKKKGEVNVPRRKVDPTLNDKISVWQGDIARLEIDAIVNAANARLAGGGGIDGAIHRRAGDKELMAETGHYKKGCPTGEALITSGFALPAKYIIHTVGPRGENAEKLKLCYQNSLNLAYDNGVRSIAFCGISTGIYGYPNDKAADVAISTVRAWLEEDHGRAESMDRIIFCVFLTKDADIYENKVLEYFPIS